MRKRPPAILFWLLAALSTAMLAVLLAVVGGIVPVDAGSDRAGSATELAPSPEAVTQTAETTTETTPESTGTTEEPQPEASAATTTATPQPTPTLVVVTASRGDSWFSARVGSESGRVLDERVLTQGESVSLRGARIWLTVGAAGNVDVTVNGEPRAISPGTVELVLTRAGSSAN